ncbi:MAG: hypothetical protein IKR21_04425, partial [Oscillospiraceae bacterium]|nr:hypothetical protein [Oscillospiraceae bacterium]
LYCASGADVFGSLPHGNGGAKVNPAAFVFSRKKKYQKELYCASGADVFGSLPHGNGGAAANRLIKNRIAA